MRPFPKHRKKVWNARHAFQIDYAKYLKELDVPTVGNIWDTRTEIPFTLIVEMTHDDFVKYLWGKSGIKGDFNLLLGKLVDEAIGSVQKQADEKGLKLGIDVPHDLEVLCDPKYTRIVYNNLVSNAAKSLNSLI